MVYYPQNTPYSFGFLLTMTLSKSPASDLEPVNKSGRKIFPVLPVQFQCKLVRSVQDSSFSFFFKESKMVKLHHCFRTEQKML